MVDEFVASWEANTAAARGAKGFRGTRLHRALDPDAHYPLVNVARWDSVEHWEATVRQHVLRCDRGADGSPQGPHLDPGWVSAHPNLYTVVHVTPDAQEATADRPSEQAVRGHD